MPPPEKSKTRRTTRIKPNLRRRPLSYMHVFHAGAYLNPSLYQGIREPLPGTYVPGLLFAGLQLIPVMVQPQRGQSEPVPDRHVVPQLEQVLAVAAAPLELQPQPFAAATLPHA